MPFAKWIEKAKLSLVVRIVKSLERLSRLVVQLLFLERTFRIDQSPKYSEQ